MLKDDLTSSEIKSQDSTNDLVEPLLKPKNFNKIFMGIVVAAVIFGLGTGYTLAGKSSPNGKVTSPLAAVTQPKTADQDNRTFRDFAEGTVEALPKPKNASDYVEGTYLLKRVGTTPVTLTSSVVDLSKYQGKKVKVYGETQKAIKAGWLMDVGRVDEIE